MKTFDVPVQKTMLVKGHVTVKARSQEEANARVSSQIKNWKLSTSEAKWGEPEYDDFSFGVQGED